MVASCIESAAGDPILARERFGFHIHERADEEASRVRALGRMSRVGGEPIDHFTYRRWIVYITLSRLSIPVHDPNRMCRVNGVCDLIRSSLPPSSVRREREP